MDTITDTQRYELLISTHMLFYPDMPEDMFDEIAKYLPKAEDDKDNSKLSNFLAGVALIGNFLTSDDVDEKCNDGLESVKILKKYGVTGERVNGLFKNILDFCK